MLGDPNANIIFGGVDRVTPVIRKVGAEVKGFQKTVGGVGGAIPIFDKLAAATGGLITPTTLAVGGAIALGGALIDATRAAAEEEISLAKLDASLRANIRGFDGNTKAIESTIRSRERFAFSDDELRESLSLLVAATHDVAKAFTIQRTAMDLARLKGISLKDATTALVRVEGGQFRALKGLGIVLKEGATQTEALAAVQAVAAGQAEAYSNTIIGKTEAIKIKFHDLQETVGRFATPVLSAFADKALESANALDEATGSVDASNKAFQRGADALADFVTSGFSVPVLAQSFAEAGADIRRELEGMEDSAKDTKRDMTRVFEGGASEMETATKAFYKPVWKQFDIAAFKAEQAARELPGKMADGILDGVDDIESAYDELKDILKEDPNPRAQLLGKLYSKKLADGLASQNPYARAKAEALRLAILKELAAHYFFTAGADAGRTFSRGLRRSTSLNTNPNIRAKGGPVTKGEAYIVGEERPEVFVPNQSGVILPSIEEYNNRAGGSTVGSSGGGSSVGGTNIFVNVNASGVLTPAAAQKLANDLGPTIATYLRRQNLIPARV